MELAARVDDMLEPRESWSGQIRAFVGTSEGQGTLPGHFLAGLTAPLPDWNTLDYRNPKGQRLWWLKLLDLDLSSDPVSRIALEAQTFQQRNENPFLLPSGDGNPFLLPTARPPHITSRSSRSATSSIPLPPVPHNELDYHPLPSVHHVVPSRIPCPQPPVPSPPAMTLMSRPPTPVNQPDTVREDRSRELSESIKPSAADGASPSPPTAGRDMLGTEFTDETRMAERLDITPVKRRPQSETQNFQKSGKVSEEELLSL